MSDYLPMPVHILEKACGYIAWCDVGRYNSKWHITCHNEDSSRKWCSCRGRCVPIRMLIH